MTFFPIGSCSTLLGVRKFPHPGTYRIGSGHVRGTAGIGHLGEKNRGAFPLATARDSPRHPRMAKLHYSERVRDYSDEELRTELLTNDPSWGASQIVRNEIARRNQPASPVTPASSWASASSLSWWPSSASCLVSRQKI